MSISAFCSLSELINFRRVTEIFVSAMSIARQFADNGNLRAFDKISIIALDVIFENTNSVVSSTK